MPSGTREFNFSYTRVVTDILGWLKRGLVFAFIVLLGSSVANAKSYFYDKIVQDVYFQANGVTRVVDTRTYNFDGSYSKANLTVDSRGSVDFQSVRALDNKPFYGSARDGNTVNWQYAANDETRTFQIVYTMTNELAVAQDAAKFDRAVLEPQHERVRQYTVRLHAPQGNPQPFRVFVFTRNSRIGQLTFDDAKGIATVNLENVSEDEWVRTVALLPAAQFTNRTQSGNQFAAWLQQLSAETKDFRAASATALERGGFAPPPPPPAPWLYLIPLGGLAFFGSNIFRTYQKYGREPYIPEVGRYYREPAEEIPPGVVPYVMSASNPGSSALGRAVGATLLDFARRGFLTLHRKKTDGFLGIGGKDETQFELTGRPEMNDLSEFERRVWTILNSARGFDNIVTPAELSSTFQHTPNLGSSLALEPRLWYENTHGSLMDTSDSGKTTGWVIAAFLAGVGCIAGGFFTLETLGPLSLAIIVTGVLLILGGILANIVLGRWNADKLLNAKRWEAYRNFLTDFSAMEQAPAEHLKLWDYHFVYASALGVAQKYLQNVRRLAESHPTSFTYPYWIGRSYGYGYGSTAAPDLSDLASQLTAINSLSSIASNLDSLQTALNPQSSGSSGGFGGGSFGGSSGGGGSSGAS
jgi:uncharacterized membrane protein